MRKEATASCVWQTRSPQHGWLAYAQSVCRATVTENFVHVTLPKGGRVRFKRRAIGYDGARWYRYLGRDRETRIEVHVHAASRTVLPTR